jgi:Fic family protein
MRRDEFTPQSPGALVDIPGGCAFVPSPLPPAFEPSWNLATLLARARGALGELLGQARLVANDRLVIAPLLTRDAVDSNRIEGTHTLIEDVLLQRQARLPLDPIRRDLNLEVLKYVHALEVGTQAIHDGQPLSLFFLRALHRALIEGTRGGHRRPGQLREVLVAIGRDGQGPGEAAFVPPPPEHVVPALEQLVDFVSREEQFGPLVTGALLHYQFETIHPFEDGNGRLGRLLIPLHLLAVGAIDRPVVYLSSYFEEHRDEYTSRLKRVSTAGDWAGWVEFYLRAFEASCLDARGRVTKVLELHRGYRERAAAASKGKLALLAVDRVMEEIYVTAPGLATALGGRTYKAARAALDVLSEVGVVRPIPDSYPQLWVAQELLDLVYKD